MLQPKLVCLAVVKPRVVVVDSSVASWGSSTTVSTSTASSTRTRRRHSRQRQLRLWCVCARARGHILSIRHVTFVPHRCLQPESKVPLDDRCRRVKRRHVQSNTVDSLTRAVRRRKVGCVVGDAALLVIMAPLTSLCTGGSRRQSTRCSRQGDIVKQCTWPRLELFQISFSVRVCMRQLIGAWLEI